MTTPTKAQHPKLSRVHDTMGDTEEQRRQRMAAENADPAFMATWGRAIEWLVEKPCLVPNSREQAYKQGVYDILGKLHEWGKI